MARKTPLRCEVGSKRFTVISVNGNRRDTYAGRNFQQALEATQPNRGDRLDVFVTCAKDAGEARLLTPMHLLRTKRPIKLVKTMRYKRGG